MLLQVRRWGRGERGRGEGPQLSPALNPVPSANLDES